MIKTQLIFVFLAFTLNSFGQIAVITDPDGYTNVRKDESSKSEIIYQVKEDEVFFVDVESIDLKSNWIKVWISKDKFSKYYSANDFTGYIHHSRIKSLDSLPISKDNNPKLVFKIEKADTTRVFEKTPYGLEISLSRSYEVKEMKIIWKGETLAQEQQLFNDLYNIQFEIGTYSSDQKKFTTYKQGETYFIKQACADGGGYYEVVWVIRNGKILQRLAGWIT